LAEASLLESWMREAVPGVTAWLSAARATAVLAWDNATVPEASARVTVRSAVGSVAVTDVSKSSAVPSNTRALLAPQTELAALTLLVDSVEVNTVAVVGGNVNVVLSVPARVRLFVTAKVLPSVSVRVAPVAGAVSVILFTVVAEATPKVGVVKTGAVSVLLVRVAVLVAVRTVPLALGNVMVVPSVPSKVRLLLAARVLPFATVNVPVLVVIVRPLTLVAVATPRVGVVITGAVSVLLVSVCTLVKPTRFWLVLGNVMVVPSVPSKVRLLFTAKVLPLARSNVPVEVSMVKPLTLVAVATPKTGVTKVGLVLNTAKPVPVSFVIAASSWALVATSVLLVRLTVLLVSVSVPARVAAVPEAAGPVSVTPLGIVSVPVVAVIVSPLKLVAVITPCGVSSKLATVTFLSTPESLIGNSSAPVSGALASRPVTVAAFAVSVQRRVARISREVFMGV